MNPDHPHNHSHPLLSLRVSVKNWHESELPFFQKLKVAACNEATKLRTRQHCCGHPGEPGCWEPAPESRGGSESPEKGQGS